MILTAIEIRTTSDNVKRGNIVEFAAATCDVEEPSRRWQAFERLIDNDQILGNVAGMIRCDSQFRLIEHYRKRRNDILVRESKLVTDFRDWCVEQHDGNDYWDHGFTVVGDQWDRNTLPWLQSHLTGWTTLNHNATLDVGSLCYVEGSRVPNLAESLASLGVDGVKPRKRAVDTCLDVLTVASRFFSG